MKNQYQNVLKITFGFIGSLTIAVSRKLQFIPLLKNTSLKNKH